MSQISDEKLLHHLRNGISRLTPDQADSLWDQPVTPADGSEWYLDPSVRKAPSHRRWIGAVAACLVLCLLSGICFQAMPTASVYLDVNPSVSLQVNYRNRVTKATACNQDAVEILEDMDLSGTDLDVAVYAILGSMVHHGYLTEDTDTVLVSVHSSNHSRADALEAQVTDIVSQGLQEMIQAGEVISHQLEDNEMIPDSSEPDFSPGKAAFIDGLKEKYPQLDDEDLEDMSIDEIVSQLEEDGLDYAGEDVDREEEEDDLDDLEDLDDIDDLDDEEDEEEDNEDDDEEEDWDD